MSTISVFQHLLHQIPYLYEEPLYCPPARLQAQQFTFKKHPLSIEGFENAQVMCLLESSTGWHYLASAKGLLQYNRLNFNPLATGSPITALYEDRQKCLWCGLKNGDIAP